MRLVLVASMLVAALASGCSGPEADPAANLGDALDDAADGNATAQANATANLTANRAPLANLTADALAGPAPLNVTFVIAGSDPDGDNLTWTLAVADTVVANGTGLPANATHRFLDAGNFSVDLTVSDGTNATSANLTVAVAAALPLGPLICEAEGETAIPGGFYQDRMSWIFEESNGLPGLQYTAEASLLGEHDAAGEGCENGDTLLF